MKLSIKAGSTSQSINLFMQDSSSTTGAGLTGLAYNTASLTAYYTFAGANATATAITLATLAAVTSAYSSGGFKEIDATNMPGWYRFDIPDAALATSKGRSVGIHFKGATNLAPLPVEIELTGWDNQDAVHGGMSALPNTAVTTNGSLITSGSGSDQLTVSGGIASSDAKKINAVSTSSVTTINANVGTTQPINFTGTGASALAKSDMVDIAGAAVSTTAAQIGVNVVNVGGTAQTAKDLGASATQTGDSYARLGAPAGASVSADIAAVPTAGENASAVWEESTGAHATSGTMGVALENAASAGDPWSTSLPGSYSAGQAGYIVGNNLDAAVSTRLGTSGYTSPPSAATISTQVWSEAVPGSFGTGSAGMVLGDNLDTTISSRLATSSYTAPDNSDIVAIKAKTDNLPASPAAVSDIPSAATIAGTVWDEATSSLTTTGSIGALLVNDIDAAISTRAVAGDAMTLTTAYDSAKTAAKTTDLPTNFSALSIDTSGNVAITGNLKKNTAKSGFMFVMTDSTNHVPTAGLTVTATRSIDGAAFAACANAPSGVSNGTYKIDLSASDMNGDHVMLRFTATGADDLLIELVTQP